MRKTLILNSQYGCLSCSRRLCQLYQRAPLRFARSLNTSSCADESASAQRSASFRKQLKDESRVRKQESAVLNAFRGRQADDWELTVGIEIHAELNTKRKLFSPAYTSLSDPPNTHVAPFDLALPGAQPQFQKETLIPALRAALALGCQLQRRSSWDRKHYFWWDQPNGYQITQFYGETCSDLICSDQHLWRTS